MKLLIIVLNYRITDMTIGCLRSLAPEIARIPGEARVAVLENGTGGDAEQRIRDAIAQNGWGAWADFDAVSPNRGFSGGNNLVIRKWLGTPRAPQYFLLLNADTEVYPGALETLVRFMDAHPKVGVAAGRAEWEDGNSQGTPFRFKNIATEFDDGLRLGIVTKLLAPWVAKIPTPTQACRVDWVAFAGAIIRREVIEAIGPLDDGLYTHFDDIDFCLNATRAGWEIWHVPESRILHYEGASTGIVVRNIERRPDYWFQARRRFYLKNHGALYAAAADAAFLSGFALWRLRRWLQRKPDTDPPHLLADAFRNSVFVTGFKLRKVENPLMKEAKLSR
jgi:GT2 family glycosyltransferase